MELYEGQKLMAGASRLTAEHARSLKEAWKKGEELLKPYFA